MVSSFPSYLTWQVAKLPRQRGKQSMICLWFIGCCLKLIINLIDQPIKAEFYCTTIAYHVELNAFSGGHRHPAKVQEK